MGSLITDGNMAAAGITNWTAQNATPSKESVDPHAGAQSIKIGNVGSPGYAYQDIDNARTGERYILAGYAHGDGGAGIPGVAMGSMTWTGTASTDWQDFAIDFIADGQQLQIKNSSTGYTQFDSLVLIPFVEWIRMDEVERAFLWKDADGYYGKENTSIRGFVEGIKYQMFSSDYNSGDLAINHNELYSETRKNIIYSAIKEGLYSEQILDTLAAQMKFPGWEYVGKYNVTTTVRDRKNEVLKKSHELIRHRGTPFAVAKILEVFGYSSVVIYENIDAPILYNGFYKYDGLVAHAGNLDFQLFSVELTATTDITGGADDDQLEAIIDLINNYKKERVELYQLIIHEPSNPGGVVVQVWGA